MIQHHNTIEQPSRLLLEPTIPVLAGLTEEFVTGIPRAQTAKLQRCEGSESPFAASQSPAIVGHISFTPCAKQIMTFFTSKDLGGSSMPLTEGDNARDLACFSASTARYSELPDSDPKSMSREESVKTSSQPHLTSNWTIMRLLNLCKSRSTAVGRIRLTSPCRRTRHPLA